MKKAYLRFILIGYLVTTVFMTEGVAEDNRPLWEAQYKIRPSETARLTAADVVGPDGIVYPNWTRCGVQGGIPAVKAAARIEEFGGKADDAGDDAAALAVACRAVGEKGGGAVVLGAGTYYLDRQVTVRHDRVVIRGQGAERTRLIFRYAVPEKEVVFYGLKGGDKVHRDTMIELHSAPTGLAKMRMELDGKPFYTWERGQHSGNTFWCRTGARGLFRTYKEGRHRLKGVAEYRDGSRREAEIEVELVAAGGDRRELASSQGAITFLGKGYVGNRIKLAEDGRRGAKRLVLEHTRGLKAGDCLYIEGPATARWKTLTQNACKWGLYRVYEAVIEKVEGQTVWLGQPLRIEFPVIDGSYVREVKPIQYGGVEDFYLEQTENLWISSVLFDHGWNCWAKGVRVKKCGRYPVYGRAAKWCEIRECVFDDAWFKGGGGTAYTGWDRCWDCLIEDIETFKMRHAPLFQWAASGNVIRRGVFHESDGQWHAGWTNENLIEQCVITSVRGHGGYGYGMWASPPQDQAHGPNGPRNVVYNCDVRSEKTGVWLGGMNENWLILYNRFVVEKGEGLSARVFSFDHIIRGNVFILRDQRSPMVRLLTADCTGIELVDNALYGGDGKVWAGKGRPAVEKGNAVHRLSGAKRPAPAVASIYEWQQAHAK